MEGGNPRSRISDVKEHRHSMKKKIKYSSSGEEVRVKKKNSKRPRSSSSDHKRRRCRVSSDSDSSLDSELSSSDSSDASLSSSSSSPSPERKRKRKHKKLKYTTSKKSSNRKHKLRHKAVKMKKKKPKKKKLHEKVESPCKSGKVEAAALLPYLPPTAEGAPQKSVTGGVADIKAVLAAQTAKVKGPMTKEEYERQQSIVRRVYDPDTGRHRLVKGDGEIIEEIVSRERHKAINKQATFGDGSSFQALTRKLL